MCNFCLMDRYCLMFECIVVDVLLIYLLICCWSCVLMLIDCFDCVVCFRTLD